jgi:hypothetical protein
VGAPPRAGFSNGAFDCELPGSGETGAFLDSSTGTGLIYNDLSSSVPGRYVFFFRDGTAVPEPTATTLVGVGLVMLVVTSLKRRRFIHTASR